MIGTGFSTGTHAIQGTSNNRPTPKFSELSAAGKAGRVAEKVGNFVGRLVLLPLAFGLALVGGTLGTGMMALKHIFKDETEAGDTLTKDCKKVWQTAAGFLAQYCKDMV